MWYIYSSTTKSIDQESKPLEETIKIDGMEDFPPDLQGLIDRFLRVLLGKLQLREEDCKEITLCKNNISVDNNLVRLSVGYDSRELYNLTERNLEKFAMEILAQEKFNYIQLPDSLNAFDLNISENQIQLKPTMISRDRFLFHIDSECKNRQDIIDKIDLLVLFLKKILLMYPVSLSYDDLPSVMQIQPSNIIIWNSPYVGCCGKIEVSCDSEVLNQLTEQRIENFILETLIPDEKYKWYDRVFLEIRDNSVVFIPKKLQESPFYIWMDVHAGVFISATQKKQLVQLTNLLLRKLNFHPPIQFSIELLLDEENFLIRMQDEVYRLKVHGKLSEILPLLEKETPEIIIGDLAEQIDWPSRINYIFGSGGRLVPSKQKIYFFPYLWKVDDFLMDVKNDYLRDVLSREETRGRLVIGLIKSIEKALNIKIKIDEVTVYDDMIGIFPKGYKKVDDGINIFCNREQWDQITPENSNNIKIHDKINVQDRNLQISLIIEKDCIHMMPYNMEFPVPVYYWYISPENILPPGVKPTYEVWKSQIMLIQKLLLSIIKQLNIELQDLKEVSISEDYIRFFTINGKYDRKIALLFELNSLTEDSVNQLIVDPNVAKNWQQKSKYLEDRYIESGALILKNNRVQLLSSILQTQPFSIFLNPRWIQEKEQKIYCHIIMSPEIILSFIGKLIRAFSISMENIRNISISNSSICISGENINITYNSLDLLKLTKENIEKQWKIQPKPRAPLFMYRINLQVIDDTITLQYF